MEERFPEPHRVNVGEVGFSIISSAFSWASQLPLVDITLSISLIQYAIQKCSFHCSPPSCTAGCRLSTSNLKSMGQTNISTTPVQHHSPSAFCESSPGRPPLHCCCDKDPDPKAKGANTAQSLRPSSSLRDDLHLQAM